MNETYLFDKQENLINSIKNDILETLKENNIFVISTNTKILKDENVHIHICYFCYYVNEKLYIYQKKPGFTIIYDLSLLDEALKTLIDINKVVSYEIYKDVDNSKIDLSHRFIQLTKYNFDNLEKDILDIKDKYVLHIFNTLINNNKLLTLDNTKDNNFKYEIINNELYLTTENNKTKITQKYKLITTDLLFDLRLNFNSYVYKVFLIALRFSEDLKNKHVNNYLLKCIKDPYTAGSIFGFSQYNLANYLNDLKNDYVKDNPNVYKIFRKSVKFTKDNKTDK